MLYDPRWEKVDNVGRVLLRAADLIDRHGWCNVGPAGDDGSVCLLVAIGRANHALGFEKARLRDKSVMRLKRYLNQFDIIGWNERVCGSKEEAVAALRGAALCR